MSARAHGRERERDLVERPTRASATTTLGATCALAGTSGSSDFSSSSSRDGT